MRSALVVLVLAALFLPFAAAGGFHASMPFADPRQGDGALYRVETTWHARGEPHVEQVYVMWDVESILVPGAEGARFPTLRMSAVAPDSPYAAPSSALALGLPGFDPGKDYAARDPLDVRQRSSHVTRPGGDLLARTTEWHVEEAAEEREQWAHRTERADACDLAGVDATLARLAGATRQAALQRLEACGASASWEESTLAVLWPDGTALRIEPAHGLPLPHRWTLETSAMRQEATLLGWRTGEGALPEARPLPPPVRVGLVPWGADGPATGDLAEHPFREAKRAVASQTGEGRTFFAEHPDARVLYATHAWTPATLGLPGDADPWASRAKGVPCSPAAAAGAALGETQGEWSASWVAPKASLFAIADRVTVGPAGASTERAVAATRDSGGTDEFGLPAVLAPAPRDVAAHLHALDDFQLQGTYSIDFAFAPTAQGNLQGAAAVSRGVCEQDPATGRIAYVGLSLWFVDGEARSIVGTTIHRGEPSAAAALLADLSPPPTEAGPAPPGRMTLATGALLAGGAAVAGLVAFRAIEPLYSRIFRASALDSEKRARLLEAIHRRPGATARALAEELAMPVNTLEHHARVLRRLKYVRRVRTAGGVAYYASEHPRAPLAHVLDKAHAEEALDVIATRPGVTQREIVQATGARASHLSSLLRELEKEGLIERRREGRVLRVTCTERALSLRARK